jgi:hypothetical protein
MWRLRLFCRREWLTVVVGLALLGALAYLSATGRWGLRSTGFGPGWHCAYPGKGDPICIKDPPGQK